MRVQVTSGSGWLFFLPKYRGSRRSGVESHHKRFDLAQVYYPARPDGSWGLFLLVAKTELMLTVPPGTCHGLCAGPLESAPPARLTSPLPSPAPRRVSRREVSPRSPRRARLEGPVSRSDGLGTRGGGCSCSHHAPLLIPSPPTWGLTAELCAAPMLGDARAGGARLPRRCWDPLAGGKHDPERDQDWPCPGVGRRASHKEPAFQISNDEKIPRIRSVPADGWRAAGPEEL